MGRYWLFPSTVMAKSDIRVNKYELFPTLANASLLEPMFLGRDVCVVLTGSRADANTIDATGFQRAILRYLLKHLPVDDRFVYNFFRD